MSKIRCSGINKNGTQCRNLVSGNSLFCWRHKDQENIQPYLSSDYTDDAYIGEYRGDQGDTIWGHGPFTIKLKVGNYRDPLITQDLEFNESRYYTLGEINAFYDTKLTLEYLEELKISLEEGSKTRPEAKNYISTIDYLEALYDPNKTEAYRDKLNNLYKNDRSYAFAVQHFESDVAFRNLKKEPDYADLQGNEIVIEGFSKDEDGKYIIELVS